MENGESLATGANARQNTLTALRFAIDFVIRQRRNIAEDIARWVLGVIITSLRGQLWGHLQMMTIYLNRGQK